MQNNYGTPAIEFVRGKGVYLWDAQGKKYLDFLGGIATNLLGQAHESVSSAVSQQIKTMGHISNLYAHPQGTALARKLQLMVGDSDARVFFCNSGTEANEAAIKLSRLTGRKKIVSTIGSFHGRTIGALSVTGQESKRRAFLPLLSNITFVPYGDVKAAKKAINRRTAMVIVEAIQGENGVVVPPAGYLKALRDICDETGALFVLDAVQTGMGRTGEWFGYEPEDIKPDVITLAKGLGAGLPLGAMITVGKNAPEFKPGDHGSTFGGNPVACAAANAAIDFMAGNDTLLKVRNRSLELRSGIAEIPGVASVRGAGLLLGIVLEKPLANRVAQLCASHGLLVNAPKPNVIRIAPPLIITKKHVRDFVAIFTEVMREAAEVAGNE